MSYCCGEYIYYRLSSTHRDHLRTSYNHNWCDDCDIDFASWLGLKEHWVQSRAHSYCQHCDTHCADDYDLEAHYDLAHIRCAPCGRFFKNALGLHEHYRQSPVHSSKYCVPCKRLFQTEANLRSHMNSSIHKAKDVACPGYQCGQRFVSQSALLLHLEAGTCRSGINRSIVNRVVTAADVRGVITNPSRLLTGPTGNTEVSYVATRAAWNGRAYECYLCHGEYKNFTALNQHLASPRHQEKIYFCPLTSCREKFNTLSGLCQHIESERCGVLKFRQAKDTLEGLVSGMRAIRVN